MKPTKKHPTHDRIRVEYQPLASIKVAKRNPKKHKAEDIDASVNRFGYTAPMMQDERTGLLVAGHGRLKTLKAKKANGEAPPARIEVDAESGDWLVPVLRGVAFNSDAEAEAYLLTDNRLVELGGYDNEALVEALKAVNDATGSLQGTGWNNDDLAALLGEAVNQNATPAGGAVNGEANTGDKADEAPLNADDDGRQYQSKFAVLVNCKNEAEQKEVFEKLVSQGFDVKVLAI